MSELGRACGAASKMDLGRHSAITGVPKKAAREARSTWLSLPSKSKVVREKEKRPSILSLAVQTVNRSRKQRNTFSNTMVYDDVLLEEARAFVPFRRSRILQYIKFFLHVE
jgi:hypothetical protein